MVLKMVFVMLYQQQMLFRDKRSIFVNKKNIPLLAMLTTLAIIISMLERLVPLDFMIVGAKLGLANTITIFVLNRLGKFEAILVLLTRILTVTLLSGRVSSLLFSLIGGLFAFSICCLLIKYYPKKISFIGISIASCAFHHIGQIVAGVIMLSSYVVVAYLPYLLIISIPIGYITGSFLEILFSRLKNIEID